MIRNRAVTDTTNPPGQVRYLRDVIKKYQEEERVQEALQARPATQPSTQAEERLQRVLVALEGLARQAEARQGAHDRWWAQELRLVVKENTNKA